MRTARIEIEDEVNIRIRGLDPDTLEEAKKALTYYVPGHRFMPHFKQGWWDGTIKLMTDTGKTKLGLLEDIAPILTKRRYEFTVVDKRKDWSHVSNQLRFVDENAHEGYFWKKDNSPIVLRDYQVEGINTALEKGSGILQLATAGGKSIICGTIAQQYAPHGRVVVIVPTIQLALQTRGTFRQIGINAGIWYGEEHDRQQVTLATWQSLDHFHELMDGVICVIVDECQDVKGKTLESILAGPAKNVPYRFGCTGTLPENTLYRKQIMAVLGPIIFDLPAWKLQEKGILAQSHIHQVEYDDLSNPDWKKFRRTTEPEWNAEVTWYFSNQDRLDAMAALITEISADGSTLVLVAFKASGRALEKLIPGAIYMDGDISGKIREKVFSDFNSRTEGALICTSHIASVGIDIPNLRNIVFIEIGKQFVKIIQTIGRGLRKEGDKTHVNIWDFHGNDGFSANHAKERQRLYRKAKQTYEKIEMGY